MRRSRVRLLVAAPSRVLAKLAWAFLVERQLGGALKVGGNDKLVGSWLALY